MIFKSVPGKKQEKNNKNKLRQNVLHSGVCCCLFLFFSLETRVGDSNLHFPLTKKDSA